MSKVFDVQISAELRSRARELADDNGELCHDGDLMVRAADEIELLNNVIADMHNKWRHSFERQISEATDTLFNRLAVQSLRKRRLGK